MIESMSTLRPRKARLWWAFFALLAWNLGLAIADSMWAFVGSGFRQIRPHDVLTGSPPLRMPAMQLSRRTGKCRRSSAALESLDVLLTVDLGQYQSFLSAAPMQTKAVTSAVLFGLGNLISQVRSPSIRSIDCSRLAKYMLIGLGSGVLWTLWYDASQSWVTQVVSSSIMQVGLSIILEQFLWCPILYSMYLIPLNTVLDGGDLKAVRREVPEQLGNLLVANAKVWTLANIIVYNAPLELRVLVSNTVEIVWANVCSDFLSVDKEISKQQPPKPSAAKSPVQLLRNS